MPSRVNTKFVIFLVVAVCVGGVLIAGLYMLNVSGRAKRNMRLGDEAAAAGDFRKARDYYGSAVYREPGNLEYLEKLEQVTLKVTPRTSDEALELYRGWLGILNQGVRQDGGNPERHLRLLRELHATARLIRSQWDLLIQPGEDMFRSLPDSEPQRYMGKVYRSLAIFNRYRVSTFEEIAAAVQDITEAVEHLPQSDLAWATALHGQVAMAEKMREERRTGSAMDEQVNLVREWMQKCDQNMSEGPETARMQVMALITLRNFDAESVPMQDIIGAAAKLEQTLNPEEVDSGLLTESVELMAAVEESGAARGAELIAKYVEQHPERLDKWMTLASLSYLASQIDEAESAAKRVLASEQLPVGFLAQVQNELRKRAAGLLVDIEGHRLADATPEQFANQLTKMEQSRDQLAAIVRDKDNDPLLLRADAKIAYAKNDFARAAILYDRLARETRYVDDAEVLFFSAVCLEKVNAVGRAHERVTQALQIRPGNPVLVKFKARLELAMGKRDEAAATMRLLSNDELAAEDARQLIASINSTSGSAVATENEDPVTAAVARASQAMLRGEIDSARTILTAALTNAPESLHLLHALIALEIRAGNQDTAREYLARGLKVDQNNVTFLQWDSVLKHENPVDALRAFHMTAVPDERERALSMLAGLRAVAWQQDTLASRLRQEGNTEAADKATAIATQARTEAREWAATADKLSPDDLRLLEYHLDAAVTERDWARAEQLVARLRTTNADQVDGKFYKGRLDIAHAAALVQDGKPAEARPYYQEAARNLEAVAERLNFNAGAWKSLAVAYVGLGNYAQAENAFEQAYKCNPNDLEGVRSYLEVLLRRGDQTRALGILRDAHALAPEDQTIRHMWLRLESAVGDQPMALRTRRKLAKDSPKDYVNIAELVQLLNTTQPERATILDATGTPRYPESTWARMTANDRAAAVAAAKKDWYAESDELLSRLKDRIGGELQFAVLHANMLRNRGDVVGGEAVLEKFVSDQGQSPTIESLLELGRFQVRAASFNDAANTFTRAIEVQSPTLRQADQELAGLYMQLTMYEKALEHLTPLIAASPDRNYRNQRVECLLKIKRFDEAEAALKEIIGEHGEDFMAMLLSASISEARGDEQFTNGDVAGAERRFAAQREMLNRAQAAEPTSVMPRMLLAQTLLKEYRRTQRAAALSDALHVLQDAEKTRAGTAEIGLLRVSILREQGDANAAINELKRLVQKYPDSLVARRELVELLVQQRQADQAIAVVQEAIRINPTISRWHEMLGDLTAAVLVDAPAALASYTAAYDLSPSPTLLLKMTDAALAMKEPNCRPVVERYAARTAAELDANPLLREGYGRALNCINRRAEALDQLRLAYAQRKQLIKDKKMQPQEMASWFLSVTRVFTSTEQVGRVDSSAAEQFVLELCGGTPDLMELRGLARLWVNSGDGTLARTIDYQLQAVKLLDSAEKQVQIESYHELASYHYTVNQFKEAAGAYESLLKLDPDRVEALNNVAYITAVWFKDPKKALPFAERAAQLAPKQHSVLDTLGWVHYLAGDLEKAKQWLQESLRIQPAAATYAHMGAVLLATGDLNGAKYMLDEASRLNPDLETQREMTRVQEELKARQNKP